MEPKQVQNTSQFEVVVQWDGINHYFAPGEVKSFPSAIAASIANEHAALKIVVPEEPSFPQEEIPQNHTVTSVEPKKATKSSKKG